MTDDNALLPQLVAAMREVAERERGASLASLQASVREATDALTARSESGAEALRKHADDEIAGIGEWVQLETQRVAAEGDRKIEARRQQLSQQLTDHEQRSHSEVERLNERFAEYERELASFFAQLNEITDPAAFGAAAKGMPRPPTLTDAASADAATTAPDASGQTHATAAQPAEAPTRAPEPTEAAEPQGAPSAAKEQTDAPRATAETAPAEPAPSPTPAEAEAQMVQEHRSRLDALGIARDDTATASEPAAETTDAAADAATDAATDATGTTGSGSEADASEADDTLRSRLAELDKTLGEDEASGESAAKASANGSETATAIVVHGLGSFGAITSFKQALERVEGVHGISLSLGPTGEFVYRATHDAGFDLVAAIEGIENGNASIDRQQDGSLRVNVQRSR